MTPDQRSAIVSTLACYGASLTDDNAIARPERVTGVTLEIRKGRLRAMNGESLLASFPASDVARGVAAFVERFWYWTTVQP